MVKKLSKKLSNNQTFESYITTYDKNLCSCPSCSCASCPVAPTEVSGQNFSAGYKPPRQNNYIKA